MIQYTRTQSRRPERHPPLTPANPHITASDTPCPARAEAAQLAPKANLQEAETLYLNALAMVPDSKNANQRLGLDRLGKRDRSGLPPAFPLQRLPRHRHETHRQQRIHPHPLCGLGQPQQLLIGVSHRQHQPPAHFQLLQQRLG